MRRRIPRPLVGLLALGLVSTAMVLAGPATAADQPLPAEVVGSTSPVVSNVAETSAWGVIGIGGAVHFSTNLRVPVFAIQQVGDRVFVGGMFARVKKGSGGAETDQPFLAAFDLAGNWISTFRPVLNASVYALAATADGKLIVGGDFTSINGEAQTTALAALDPLTGQVVAGWRASLTRPYTTDPAVVRALAVNQEQVYAAGNFGRHTSSNGWRAVTKAVRVAAATGRLDTTWLPKVNGSGVWAMAVSPDASRVTLGGYFSNIAGAANTAWIGVVRGSDATVIPGLVYQKTHDSSGHVQAIADNGSRLWYSGSQHYIFQHNPTTWQREEGTTYVWGGDGQAIEIADGILYNSCHCAERTAYTDSYSWPTPTQGSTAHDINGIAAYTESGFTYQDSFYPQIWYENGDGAWALQMDTRGCLWVGGDVYRLDEDTPYRWARGFARLCQDDHAAPTKPTGLTATPTGAALSDAALAWAAATDNRGVVRYDVYRDGVVIGTATTTTYTDAGATPGAIYRVRAVDARGNKSATSDAVTFTAPAGAILVAGGSTWRYQTAATNPGVAWRAVDFDDAAWSAGPAQLGFGDGDEATVTPSGTVVTLLRHAFMAASTASTLRIEVLVDDGAVVYLNNMELTRDNMPSGTLTWPGYPLSSKAVPAERTWVTYEVPGNALRAGANVLAVTLHNSNQTGSDLSFDLRLTAL